MASKIECGNMTFFSNLKHFDGVLFNPAESGTQTASRPKLNHSAAVSETKEKAEKLRTI